MFGSLFMFQQRCQTRCSFRVATLLSIATLIGIGLFPATLRAQAAGPQPKSEHKHKANRLAQESSPYLLQHAHNPVDWFPWGTEAFKKAQSENKPIFLSIGYSSCFWCHVMERKVFENEVIAKYMNDHFVCIKVDREERPDIDEIYMLAVQVYFQMAGSAQGGGWPLSMFLTPKGEPIAGGTYFPPEDMPGRPGFMTVMKQIDAAWKEQPQAILRTSAVISKEVRRLSQPPVSFVKFQLEPSSVKAAVETVISRYDSEHGGFDFQSNNPNKPKFPVPSRLMLLQSQIALGSPDAQAIATKLDHTLQKMAEGGIYDHLAGGFHRYSTDRKWLVPHFEKMLYDNAQLAEVYAEAYQRTRKKQYKEVTEGILGFILEEMTDKSGGFYSALDAETDGVEGQYYVWSKAEVQGVLASGGLRYFTATYGLDQKSEFEHGYILHLSRPVSETAEQLGVPVGELETRLARMRVELLVKRRTRKPLRRDDKVLTSWNGLMIRAFARAGKVLDRQDYIDHASKASLYLLSTLRDREGRLLRTARNGKASLPAYLDDYAFFVSGLLALHDATGEEKWLNSARLLTDNQINLFWDQDRGGFYFTSHDHESLLARSKSAYDSVLPSGNSVSIQNLVRLTHLTGESTYAEHALKTVQAFGPQFRQSPGNLPYFAMAAQELLNTKQKTQVPSGAGGLFQGGVSSPKMPATNAKAKNEQRVVGLKVAASAVDKKANVKAVGFFALDGAIAGGSLPVAIEITVAEGWHINANPGRPAFVIPTELKLTGDSKLKLDGIKYPKGHDFKLDGIDEALSVYEGTILLKGVIHLPENASGEVPVTLQLRYQACNNVSCLAPKRMTLSGVIQVLPTDQQLKQINAKIFKNSAPVTPAKD